jgi:hypothetical protein
MALQPTRQVAKLLGVEIKEELSEPDYATGVQQVTESFDIPAIEPAIESTGFTGRAAVAEMDGKKVLLTVNVDTGDTNLAMELPPEKAVEIKTKLEAVKILPPIIPPPPGS